MKKLNLIYLMAALAAVVSFGLPAFGQTLLLTTTLSSATGNTTSSALTTGNFGMIAVASATGISGPVPNTSNTAGLATSSAQTYLYVDHELMQVVSVSGTTIGVIRGAGPTYAQSHASGALVFVVPGIAFYGGNTLPGVASGGSCTRTNEVYLPHIDFSSGIISDCLGGQWVNGDSKQTTRAVQWRIREPETGAQASTAVFGTNTTSVLDSIYCTEVDMPYSKLVTGLGIHVATTGNSSDLWVLGLYDSGGNLLANSATAGTAPGVAYSWSPFVFTSKYYVVGPGQYFGCMIPISTTTATVDTVTTGKGSNMLTYGATSSTAALPATFTPPTGFTTVVGPYFYVY